MTAPAPWPVIDWTDPRRARTTLESRLRAAEAEVERLTRGMCSLVLHDERGGRVGVPNVIRLLMGQPLPWQTPSEHDTAGRPA